MFIFIWAGVEILLILQFFSFKMWVKTYNLQQKDDQFVSKKIREEGAWEEDNVVFVLKAMQIYTEAVFVGKLVRICFISAHLFILT